MDGQGGVENEATEEQSELYGNLDFCDWNYPANVCQMFRALSAAVPAQTADGEEKEEDAQPDGQLQGGRPCSPQNEQV